MIIENWKELVGYQGLENSVGNVYYMAVSIGENGLDLKFQITKTEVECTLSEEELCEQLDKVLTSFSDNCENDKFAITRAQSASVKKQRRAMPNTTYKNAMYYKGTAEYDTPVIVAGFENKFALYMHPKFDDYGFMITNK